MPLGKSRLVLIPLSLRVQCQQDSDCLFYPSRLLPSGFLLLADSFQTVGGWGGQDSSAVHGWLLVPGLSTGSLMRTGNFLFFVCFPQHQFIERKL